MTQPRTVAPSERSKAMLDIYRGTTASNSDAPVVAHWSPEVLMQVMLAAADTVDPIRLLLADEKWALYVLAKASVDSHFGVNFWDQQRESCQETWLAMNGDRLRAQVAALRVVAGSRATIVWQDDE